MRKILLFFIPLLVCVVCVNAQKLKAGQKKLPTAALAAKDARTTPAQLKIDAALFAELKNPAGAAALARPGATTTGTVALPATTSQAKTPTTPVTVGVQIKAVVSPALIAEITNAGGEIVSTPESNEFIIAKIPSTSVEKIAALNDVRFIQKAAAESLTTTQTAPASSINDKGKKVTSQSIQRTQAN